MRDTSSHRVVSRSSFGPNLEWESLPELGAPERRIYRTPVWRLAAALLALFWGVKLAGVLW